MLIESFLMISLEHQPGKKRGCQLSLLGARMHCPHGRACGLLMCLARSRSVIEGRNFNVEGCKVLIFVQVQSDFLQTMFGDMIRSGNERADQSWSACELCIW